MKTIRFFSLTIPFLSLAIFMSHPLMADMNAQSIVDQFNSASGGTQMLFNYSSSKYEVSVTQQSGYTFADTSAYQQGVTASGTYYRTFCIEPSVGISTAMSATLNFANNKTTTGSTNKSVTLGVACLYTQFGIGTLDGFEYSNVTGRESDAQALRTAIQGLMGVVTADWNNKFLQQLLTINNDKSYWTGAYNPNEYYDIIGNYSVFVMNTYKSDGTPGQNFLYLATATNSSGVPEPATVLLWGLGSLGVFSVTKKRHQRVPNT